MNDPTVVSLTTLARGAAPELFARELDTILENLLDPNTDPEATRQIILTITFTGNPKREMAAVGVECKAKLAPALPATSAIWLGRRDGRDVVLNRIQLLHAGVDGEAQVFATGELRGG